jgi:hypothetical protein
VPQIPDDGAEGMHVMTHVMNADAGEVAPRLPTALARVAEMAHELPASALDRLFELKTGTRMVQSPRK